MPAAIKFCKILLYADDTLIYAEGMSAEECIEKIKADLIQLTLWLKMNKLKLNENKTKVMEINFDSEYIIKINGTPIEKVICIKYLGMVIDKNLKMNDHVDYICKKIGKKIGFFKRIRNKMDYITAVYVYNTIVKPHFEFCSTILFSCCNKGQIERLQKLQNKAMRIILRCTRITPIRFMLDALMWLNIRQKFKLNTLLTVFKIRNGSAPRYLTNEAMQVGEAQPYQLRNVNDFRVRQQGSAAARNTLIHKGFLLFNTLPSDVKNEHNYRLFKRKCIEFVKRSF